MPRVLSWIGLSLLALLMLAHAAPDSRTRRALAEPRPVLADEPACGAHGCGCPHEAVAESCCCAPEPEAPVARAQPSRRTETPRTSAPPPARRDAHSSGILTSFACNGGKRGPLRAPSIVAPSALPASSRATLPLAPQAWDARPCGWMRLAPAVEPSTPPPRGARRA